MLAVVRRISASSCLHYGQNGLAVHGISDPETRCRWFARRAAAVANDDDDEERRRYVTSIQNAAHLAMANSERASPSTVLCIRSGFLLVKLTRSCTQLCDTSIKRLAVWWWLLLLVCPMAK